MFVTVNPLLDKINMNVSESKQNVLLYKVAWYMLTSDKPFHLFVRYPYSGIELYDFVDLRKKTAGRPSLKSVALRNKYEGSRLITSDGKSSSIER